MNHYYKTEKQKKMEKVFFIALTVIAFVFIFLTFATNLDERTELSIINNTFPISNDFKVGYQNLTTEDISLVNRVMNDLDPKYLSLQHEILFVKNISAYCSDCAGQNSDNGGFIVMEFQNDETVMRYIVCHELLHTFVRVPLDLEEEIVKDASRKLICFKNVQDNDAKLEVILR